MTPLLKDPGSSVSSDWLHDFELALLQGQFPAAKQAVFSRLKTKAERPPGILELIQLNDVILLLKSQRTGPTTYKPGTETPAAQRPLEAKMNTQSKTVAPKNREMTAICDECGGDLCEHRYCLACEPRLCEECSKQLACNEAEIGGEA